MAPFLRLLLLPLLSLAPSKNSTVVLLVEKGVDFEHRLIDLSNKPGEFTSKYATQSSERAKVPLLEHNGNVVIESEVVTKYIAENVLGTNNVDLIGDETAVEAFLKAWEPITAANYKIMTATNEDDVEAAIQVLREALQGVEECLNPSTTFVCESFSTAECITAPWVQRLFVTLKQFRDIDFGDFLESYPRTKRWMEAVVQRPSVVQTGIDDKGIVESYKRFFVKYITPGAPAEQQTTN